MKKLVGPIPAALVLTLALAACGQSPAERAAAEDAANKDNAAATTEVAAEAAPAEPAVADKYDGKVVRRAPTPEGGKQDGWFYVEGGRRHWITNSAWLETKGLKASDVVTITAEELEDIPEDPKAYSPPAKPAP